MLLRVKAELEQWFTGKTNDSSHLEEQETSSSALESTSEATDTFDDMANRKGNSKRRSRLGSPQQTKRDQLPVESKGGKSGRRPVAVMVERRIGEEVEGQSTGATGAAVERTVTKALKEMIMKKGESDDTMEKPAGTPASEAISQASIRSKELQEKLDASEARCRALEEQQTVTASSMNVILTRSDAIEKESKEFKAQVQDAQEQLEKLKTRLNEARRERITIVTSLEDQLKRKNRDLDALRDEQRKSKTTITSLQNQLKQINDLYQSLKTNHDALNSTVRDLNSQNQTREAELKCMRIYCENQNMELQRVKEKNDADQVLLLQRTKELQEAQTYLTSTRVYSGADIIRLVESLNAEILQTAASITDALSLEEAVSTGKSDGLDRIVEREFRSLIGEETMAALAYRPSTDDLDTIIQSALQLIMVHDCRALINSWSLEGSEHLAGISHTDRPSIAGRWRVMTKMQTKYAHYDMLENRTKEHMFDTIRSMIAEWIQDKEHEAQLVKMIEQKIRMVLNIAVTIDKILGADVVIEDWEVFCAHPGVVFDHESMIDIFRNPHGMEGLVLCPTDLGLRRREYMPESEGEEWQVMLKAKVLLDTAFKK